MQRIINIATVLLILTFCASCSSNKTKRRPATGIEMAAPFNILKEKGIPEEYRVQLEVIQKNLLKYMLHASEKNDKQKIRIFNQAKRYFNIAVPRVLHNLEVTARNKGRKYNYTPILTPSWTIDSEIKFLNKSIRNLKILKGSPKLYDFINLLAKTNKLNLTNGLAIESNENFKLMQALLHELENTNSEDGKSLKIINAFEEKFKLGFDRIRNIAEEFKGKNKIKFKSKDMEKFFKLFLSYYYKNTDISILKNITSDILSIGNKASTNQIISIMFRNSGPGMGKTLQLLGEEPDFAGPLKALMSMLQDKGKAVPFHLVKEIIEKDRGGYKFSQVKEKPLGVGTIAQVQTGLLETEEGQKEVVIRFLKPGVEKRAYSDIKILKGFLNHLEKVELINDLPNIKKVLKSVEDFLVLDLDLKKTILRQIQAKNIYQKAIKVRYGKNKTTVHFHVPSIYLPPNKEESILHIQEFVKGGMKFSNINKTGLATKSPIKSALAAKAILQLWFGETLFGSGFSHMDAHQGNLKILLVDNSKEIKFVIMDYGMITDVSKEVQRGFILLGAGETLKDPHLISLSLYGLIRGDKPEFKHFLSLVKDHFDKNPKTSAEGFIKWAMLDLGLELNEQLATLARGGKLITQLPRIIHEEKMIKSVGINLAIKNSIRAITDWQYRIPLKFRDYFIIGSSATKAGCRYLWNKFASITP